MGKITSYFCDVTGKLLSDENHIQVPIVIGGETKDVADVHANYLPYLYHLLNNKDLSKLHESVYAILEINISVDYMSDTTSWVIEYTILTNDFNLINSGYVEDMTTNYQTPILVGDIEYKFVAKVVSNISRKDFPIDLKNLVM